MRLGNSSTPPRDFAVIGLGRFGANVARSLVQSGHNVLGVDSDQGLVQRYAHEMTQTLRLDTTDEEALKEIDITAYPVVVVAIGSNLETSILTTVALRNLGVKRIVCKATTVTGRDVLLRVGADHVVLPEHDGGTRLAEELANPGLVGQIALGDRDVVTEIRVPDWLLGQSLNLANLEERFGAHVVALVRAGKTLIPVPTAKPLLAEDILVVIGPRGCVGRIAAGE